MVELLRVDQRLLHGQVAVTWVAQIQPDSILIANDEIMQDEMGKMALKMVKPNGVKLAIRSIEDGAAILNNPLSKDLKILVIVKTVQDALRLVELTEGIEHIDIGGIKKKEGARLVGAATYVDDDDCATIEKLCEKVSDVYFQMVPAETPRNALSVIKGGE